MEAVICKKVSFAYPESKYSVLKNVDLVVQRGEMCLVTGESATGKTTLLKLLKKEIAPKGTLTGDIHINGTVGYVAQNVDESIVCDRVRSELSFGLVNEGMSREKIDILVAETASYFNLSDKLDSDISNLSGGEKQMVNLAAIMIMKPDILVLDEPCSQLDAVSAQRFVQMIRNLHRDSGITVIISEHSTAGVFESADKVLLIEQGEIKFSLSPRQAVAEMKRTNSRMLGNVPVYMSLYNNAFSVLECRERLLNTDVKSIKSGTIDGDIDLKVKNLFFAYQKGNYIIDDLNFNLYSGKINVIVGPNSSGKSTLLKLISGVLKAYRGKIKTEKKTAMLCQNVLNLFTKETCGEEVEFGKTTAFLGIDDIKNKHPYDLSGGQAQRLAIAKVLEMNADIILLDEPTQGFDSVLKERLAVILTDLCKRGKTILIVTHDIEFAGRYADFASFLSSGKIITTSPRREFFSSLNFYTTAISKISNGIADNIVSIDDLVQAGGLNE